MKKILVLLLASIAVCSAQVANVTVDANGNVLNFSSSSKTVNFPSGKLTVNGVQITGTEFDASATVKGVTKLSVAPVSPSNPIAVGDNDSRNTNARTPTAHASTHGNGGTDAVTLAILQISGLQAVLDLKAPLASPTLTGVPLAPTASVDTNTAQIATTGFVLAQGANATPIVASTGAVGTSTRYARQDHVHPAQTSVTGNAGTATALQTARTINGVSFDGTANITLPADVSDTAYGASLNGVTTIAPSQNVFYDALHSFDTDDDGKVNVLDQTAGIALTDANGVLLSPITDNSSNWNTAYTQRVITLSLATPNVLYATPVTFSDAGGAWTGTLSFNTQSANTIFAGPTTGSAATPAMRLLVPADIPDITATYQPKDADLTLWGATTPPSSYAVGDLIYASAANTLSKLVDTATGNVLISGGVTVAPSWGKVTSNHVDSTIPLKTDNLSVFAATTSAQMRAIISDELGTGAALFDGATPTSIVLTNATSIPAGQLTGSIADARLSANVPLLNVANTFSLNNANTYAGTASTPAMKYSGVPFAGTGTTSFPLLYINDANATASTTLSTAGTYFGVNIDGSQDGINVLKDGTSIFKVTSAGNVILTSGFTNTGFIGGGLAVGNGSTAVAGDQINLYSGGNNIVTMNSTGIRMVSPEGFQFSSSTTSPNSIDAGIYRHGVNQVEFNTGTVGQWGSAFLGTRDSGTNTITNGLTLGHQSTGTPAAGLGEAILGNLDSSTTADQNAFRLAYSWTTATHASRTSKAIIQLVNNAAALADVITLNGDGTANLAAAGTSAGSIATIDGTQTFTNKTSSSPTLSGTVAGTPVWASSQAITLSTAAQPNITSLGTLTALAIAASQTTAVGLTIQNTNSLGVGSVAVNNNDSSKNGEFGVRNSGRSSYGALVANDVYVYNNDNLTLMADNPTGVIKFAAGGNAEKMRIASSGVSFVGTNTNNSASAGYVGEYISASVVVGSATALTTATPKTVTSISLTAGDWDVTAIGALTGASTGTEFDVAIGTTTNSLTGTVLGDTRCQTPTVSLTGADASLMIPAARVSISSTTTYYLIVQETFTVGSPSAYGRISARRVR